MPRHSQGDIYQSEKQQDSSMEDEKEKEKRKEKGEGRGQEMGWPSPLATLYNHPLTCLLGSPTSLIHSALPFVRSQHRHSFPISGPCARCCLQLLCSSSLLLLGPSWARFQINWAPAQVKVYHASITRASCWPATGHRHRSYQEWQQWQLLGLLGQFPFPSSPRSPSLDNF